jgi:hypothetical protein
LNTVEQLVAKDISNLIALGKWVDEVQRYGSFSDRRPDLGRMFTCPGCGNRRRQGGEKCCNSTYTWAKIEGDPPKDHENEKPFGKSFIKKIQHKRHGQSRNNKIRSLILRFMADDTSVKLAAEEMNVKIPDQASTPSFGEKYFRWKEDQEQRKIRKQQKISRRINAGLIPGGTR